MCPAGDFIKVEAAGKINRIEARKGIPGGRLLALAVLWDYG
jgi:hypothetical protein